MTLNTYAGLHARRYDLVYGAKPYAEEARFVDALFREAGVSRGRLLDVACGTGRHAAELGALGWDVTGVDYAEPLLERARENAPAARFLRQDMRELDVPGKPFAAVTCLFDSIGYPRTDDDIIAALACMRRHTSPGGALAIEFLHEPALLRHASPLVVRRWELPDDGGELVRISRTHVDGLRHEMDVEYELIELRRDGTYEEWRERQTNRFFSPVEMESLLEAAGIQLHRFVPAYAPEKEIDDETFHVIAVARAA